MSAEAASAIEALRVRVASARSPVTAEHVTEGAADDEGTPRLEDLLTRLAASASADAERPPDSAALLRSVAAAISAAPDDLVAGSGGPVARDVLEEARDVLEDIVRAELEGHDELARRAPLAALLLAHGDASTDAAVRARVEEVRAAWGEARVILWEEADEARARVRLDDPGAPPLVRAAAAIWLGGDATAALASVVTESARSASLPNAPLGLFDAVRYSTAALLGAGAGRRMRELSPDRFARIARGLLDALPRVPDRGERRATVGAGLIAFVFGRVIPLPDDSVALPRRPVPLVEELDALEREVLLAVAGSVSPFEWQFRVHHAAFEAGLVYAWGAARRWLGLDPPGLTFRAVEIGADSMPLALAVQRAALGLVRREHLVVGMAALAADELVALLEAFPSFHDVHLHVAIGDHHDVIANGEAHLGWLHELFFEVATAHGLTRLAEPLLLVADRALERGPWMDGRPNAVVLDVLSASLATRGELLPARFDAALAGSVGVFGPPAAALRRMLACVPPARRDEIIACARRSPRLGRPLLLDAELEERAGA